MKKNYGSKLSIAAWVHSHVQGVECCFSSIDVHTHLMLKNTFNDILGLVFELDEYGDPNKHDFYQLSTKGLLSVRKCRKPSSDFHDECARKSYYLSQKHLIDEIDGPLEVHDFFPLPHQSLQFNENEWSTINESTTNPPTQKIFHDKTAFVEVSNTNDKTNQSHQDVPMEEEIQDKFSQNEMENDEPLENKECEGCGKIFHVDKLVQHIGHRRNNNCKAIYGLDRYKQMKEEKEKIVKRKSERKRSGLRKDYQKTYHKPYHAKNREARNEKSKERRIATKIESSKFYKRYQKFKKETKDGPSFICQSCHRTLFYRGINHNY